MGLENDRFSSFPEEETDLKVDRIKSDPLISLFNELSDRIDELSLEEKREITGDIVLLLEEYFETNLDNGFSGYRKEVLAGSFMDEDSKIPERLIRSVDIRDIINSFNKDKPVSVGHQGDHKANSAVPTPEGTDIAFSEGQYDSSVRTIVGFKTEGLDIVNIDVEKDDPRGQAHRIAYCKHIDGEIPLKNINYMLIRFPMMYFPRYMMTKEEKVIYKDLFKKESAGKVLNDEEQSTRFIYRGIDFNKKGSFPTKETMLVS